MDEDSPPTSLLLPETIERLLISSTAPFIGEFKSPAVVFTHVLPGFYDRTGSARRSAGPFSRSAFMLSFTVPEVPRMPGQVIPRYEAAGEWICSLLSLLYGKRFDAHGATEHHGSFWLPHLEQFNRPCMATLPQNDHNPRSDIAVPLDLRQIAKLCPLLYTDQDIDQDKASALKSAAKFYWQALQTAESDPEVAYLHLITAGEILANAHRPESADELDEDVRAIVDQVRRHVPKGQKAAKVLTSRMRQIKRRFRSTVVDLIDENFFDTGKGLVPWTKFDRKHLLQHVSAAYDVRSRYVHSGHAFGDWIAPRGDCSEELRHDVPNVGAAPTYVGLERVIRYCLVRFAEKHRLIVDVTIDE
jgi:hypothetical protein